MEILWAQLVVAGEKFVLLTMFFVGLGLVIKQDQFWAYGRAAAREVRLNLVYFVISVAVLSPLLWPIKNAIIVGIYQVGLDLWHPIDYATIHLGWVLLATLFVSDLVGYWRHRLMHSAWLWPAHAIHHSDTVLTWISLSRFHPINKVISMGFDIAVLVMLGFPPHVIVMNAVIRNLYGYWEHADIPWTYGPLKYVFVSPVMHRWHHVREGDGVGRNFATIFAVIDLVFGTFYVPGRRVDPLGVTDPNFPTGWVGQTLYPFKIWFRLAFKGTPRTAAGAITE